MLILCLTLSLQASKVCQHSLVAVPCIILPRLWALSSWLLQDMKDSMFTESEMAKAYKEIRQRDPRFDMVLFLQRLKKDVPIVIKACHPLLRRFMLCIKHFKAAPSWPHPRDSVLILCAFAEVSLTICRLGSP